MKFAFMSFSTPELTLDETLSLASELGYDGIEPRAGSGHAHGIELSAPDRDRKTIKQKAADAGVALCCLAVSCRYADPTTVADQVEETHQYIDLAADLGIPALRVFGGQIPEGIERDTAIENVANALGSVASHAEDRNVAVCMETHDDWCDPNHVAAIMAAVDASAIAVNWDIWHPLRRGNSTMDAAFETLRPWIRHAHIHDGSTNPNALELKPIGQGEVDHQRAMELLHADQYSGYLSGEWIKWEPHQTHLPREISTLKRLLNTIEGKVAE
ncbi:MAG: sugar phosphate isomerase/epimerase family protein [Chloroflexota bacterium]